MTVRFLADEDLDSDIINGLRSREPTIDILDVKNAGLRRTPDTVLLDLAAQQEPDRDHARPTDNDTLFPEAPSRWRIDSRYFHGSPAERDW